MNLETILDAMCDANYERWASQGDPDHDRRKRQYRAFRARILRIFETNWRTAWEAASQRCGELMERNRSLCELHELEIAAKDARIAELEAEIRQLDYF